MGVGIKQTVTVKPVLSGHSRIRPKLFTDYRLMQVKSIAECSKRAFCSTFDLHCYNLSFALSTLRGRLRQVLLYITGLKMCIENVY